MENDKDQETVNPPWVEYPNIDPDWMFWRSGTGEDWKCDVWLPYWYKLNSRERQEYLDKFPPPTEGWSMYIEDQRRLIAGGKIKEANI